LITNELYLVIQQLLIDPRVHPEDYLFNNKNDPFAAPSADLDYIADLKSPKTLPMCVGARPKVSMKCGMKA